MQSKQMLAEYMKNGFFNLGKARYSLGGHAVSALRIPETCIFASTKTDCHEKKDEDHNEPYISRELVKTSVKVEDMKNLSDKVEDLDWDDIDYKEANKKPINWFSALPPQCLREAQSNFDSALQLSAQCVSMQAQLSTMDAQYTKLKDNTVK